MIKIQSKHNHTPGSLVRIHRTNSYGVILSKNEVGDYNVKGFNLFKNWPLKQIQLYFIKKAFK